MTPGVAAAKSFEISDDTGNAWVSRWLFFVAFLVIVMVAVGGATRLTDSGLSITEWKPILGAIPPLSAADWQEAEKKVNVKGTLIGKDGMRIAIVNNQIVREGECIQVEHKKMIYRWRVKGIRESGISWEPVEAVKK